MRVILSDVRCTIYLGVPILPSKSEMDSAYGLVFQNLMDCVVLALPHRSGGPGAFTATDVE